MKKFDKKAQMMDAGTAMFESKNGYGTVLGQIKAELKALGSVTTPDDCAQDTLPPSTAEYDLFLDYSTVWRTRYLSCRVEDAGDTGRTSEIGEPIRRYAITFKEGNRSGWLRILTFVILLILMAVAIVLSRQFWITFPAVLLGIFLFYVLLIPSKLAQKTVQQLIEKISNFS